MFKSTSYMLHRKEFSLIRNLVLDNSAAILQDDSGIPYRLFGAAVCGRCSCTAITTTRTGASSIWSRWI